MSENLFDLSGKIILVTGSHQGLGYAMAEGLAAAGATVAINGRDAAKVDSAVRRLTDGGYRSVACPFDVIDSASIVRAVRAFEESTGPIDVLFNNAGIIRREPMIEMPEVTWREIVETDLTGPFLVAKAVVPGMIERRRGKIINTCSLLAAVARDTVAAYSAAKAGLKMLTQSMAVEWARHNIQANAIGPGYFSTELTKPLEANPQFDAWLKTRVPAGRWGQPRELIGPAIFLASAASDFVNGHILYVDGGLLAQL
ncbi:MAG TPA: SDR family oxidoreductase [Spirochaetia bacterium]|nr:SDR family oxidoreductase [Spirochaetia bacterium]